MFSSIHRRSLLSSQPFLSLHCKTFQKRPPCVDPATISRFKMPDQFSPPFIRTGSIQPRLSPRSPRELHFNVIDPTINQPRLQIGYILEVFLTLMPAAISSFRRTISERRLQIGYRLGQNRKKMRGFLSPSIIIGK